MKLFQKKSPIERMKKQTMKLEENPRLPGNITLLEDSDFDGFFVRVTSDIPDTYLHVAHNGAVKEVGENRELLVKNGPAGILLSALMMEVL